MTAAGRVKTIRISDKEIICIDYTNCKPDELIAVFNLAKETVVNSGKKCLLLTNFYKTFISPSFMRHVERETYPLKHLIKKNAFINTTLPQRMIIKGFSFFLRKKDFLSFASYDEAIRYLVSDENES
ncbi:MAG: hypothetical protein JSS93_04930 [Bacteroidetes bacterium]|nr:hypothetical protein [Bacteroidota bacterium]